MKRVIAKWQALNAVWEILAIFPPAKSGSIWSCTVRLDGRFEVPGATPEDAQRTAEKILEALAEMTAATEETRRDKA